MNNVEIALSTSKNNYDCRISFDKVLTHSLIYCINYLLTYTFKVPIGHKCIAPCGCTGSGKWIQFSELNRLRRKEPLQWITCQTCQQKFNYNSLMVYGGIQGGYSLITQFIITHSLTHSLTHLLTYLLTH